MAVTGAEPLYLEGGGTLSQRKWVGHFRVYTNSRADQGPTVYAYLSSEFNTPLVFGNSLDLGAYATEVQAKLESMEGTLKQWIASVTYSTADKDSDEQSQVDDPLQQPPEISISYQQFQRAIHEDINGTPLKNSAGDAFDPPQEIDDSRPIISISKNVPANFVDGGFLASYKDALNSDSVWGQEPGCVKVSNISAQKKYRGTTAYYHVTMEFAINEDGWKRKLHDRGFNYIALTGPDSFEKRRIMVKHRDAFTGIEKDVPVTTEQYLDGQGGVLALNGNPVEFEFEVYKSMPFGPLSLPDL
jgi:hypothetical protein